MKEMKVLELLLLQLAVASRCRDRGGTAGAEAQSSRPATKQKVFADVGAPIGGQPVKS
jgi:hypothetical protein